MDDLYRSKSSIARMEIAVVTPHTTRTLRIRAWTRGEEQALVRVVRILKDQGLRIGLVLAPRHLERLGEEIQDTTRRVNALEQVLAPRLAAEARRIVLALEERAREEAVRLKRFKRKREG